MTCSIKIAKKIITFEENPSVNMQKHKNNQKPLRFIVTKIDDKVALFSEHPYAKMQKTQKK